MELGEERQRFHRNHKPGSLAKEIARRHTSCPTCREGRSPGAAARGQRLESEEQGPWPWLRQLLASGARAAAGAGGAEAGREGGALGALLGGTVSSSFKEAPRVADRLPLSGPVQLAVSTGFAWAKKPRPDSTAAATVTKRSGSKRAGDNNNARGHAARTAAAAKNNGDGGAPFLVRGGRKEARLIS